ncbi:uncharacterized protein L3040_005443 [Drepanopeziza brunnea f. sp. 'multigermtubi']|uniref:Shikimate kinase n=1 Tax=Marssonina brunnea f. sp. multigermtubi (strain MB_m1) TaxID=1072389 RepID=K1WNL0_MARBU|nr:shikimate kinase [Drepanopeziza brunnea f. sp. 'multigermtubi' MB_m1]EKD13947.1 shikimate kinase [Drepanopeziza brunnea f. sp. 'multigermtubi' MB_m1]KAJ5040884.1 hypothetical protein L3040_005443 [Drepanopeziza brunnea f. sp. 'multigermtubi']
MATQAQIQTATLLQETETRPARIHILGASGSGVSTLGTNLSSALSVPVFDVDDYYWMPTDPPFTTKRAIPDRIALIKPLLSRAQAERGGWVLAGSIGTWGAELMADVEHVVFVDAPTVSQSVFLVGWGLASS